MNRLRNLASCGQSYWMDDLSRDMLRSGDLPRKGLKDLKSQGSDLKHVTWRLEN